MADQTIATWTPADLLAFIQNQVLVDPSVLPPAIKMSQIVAGAQQVTGSLDLAQGAQLLQNGQVYGPIQVPASSFTSDIVPIYADYVGVGATRAAGSSLLTQTVDIGSANDHITVVTGRQYFTRMYLPARTPVQNLHLYVQSGATSGAVTSLSAGLFSVSSGSGSSFGLTQVPGFAFTPPNGDYNASATQGIKTYSAATPVVLDSGIYYGGWQINATWPDLTLQGQSLSPAAADSILGGLPIAVYNTLTTTLAASYSAGFQTAATQYRFWMGLS